MRFITLVLHLRSKQVLENLYVYIYTVYIYIYKSTRKATVDKSNVIKVHILNMILAEQ